MGIMVMGDFGGCGLHGDNGNGDFGGCGLHGDNGNGGFWWLWSTWG